jgi:hypothetical protein
MQLLLEADIPEQASPPSTEQPRRGKAGKRDVQIAALFADVGRAFVRAVLPSRRVLGIPVGSTGERSRGRTTMRSRGCTSLRDCAVFADAQRASPRADVSSPYRQRSLARRTIMFTRRQALLGAVAAGTLAATLLPNLVSAAPMPASETEIAALPRETVTLVAPPFVHAHEQVATSGPRSSSSQCRSSKSRSRSTTRAPCCRP